MTRETSVMVHCPCRPKQTYSLAENIYPAFIVTEHEA